MNPRSRELIASARERLAGARDSLTARHAELAISAAYYAMLYAARAALSERGEHAKTHSGTWSLFSKIFVATGEVDVDVYKVTGRAQEARQEGDYDAAPLSFDLAHELIDGAAAFLSAIEALLGTALAHLDDRGVRNEQTLVQGADGERAITRSRARRG